MRLSTVVYDTKVGDVLKPGVDYVPCTLLYDAMGKRYGAAERTLHAEGWHYLIGLDAWLAPARLGRA